MPYIITTARKYHPLAADSDENVHRTRTAVATLEEVRDYVHSLGADYGAMAHLDCVLDGASRMPVGPLPDGTVIEVRPVTNGELIRMTPARAIGQYFASGPIAAFNGAHA